MTRWPRSCAGECPRVEGAHYGRSRWNWRRLGSSVTPASGTLRRLLLEYLESYDNGSRARAYVASIHANSLRLTRSQPSAAAISLASIVKQ